MAANNAQLESSSTQEGPVTNLISTLRSDNKDQLVSLLTLDPLSNSLSFTYQGEDDDVNLPVAHKTRLVFATENLRSLLTYHTLADETVKSQANVKKAQGQRRGRSTLSSEEESLGIVRNNPYGIVGTRILFPNPRDEQDRHASDVSNDTIGLMGTGSGTEAVYNPTSSRSMFSNDDPRDETDGANVVLYFIYPKISQIQALSKAIRASSHGEAFSRITKHRIVFLPRITSLSKRILMDEKITKRKDVAVHALDINLIPIENDVLTCLEMDATMADCYVHSTPSEPTTHVAQSLRKVQDVCGTIPRIQSYGKAGEMVLDRMMTLRLEEYDPYDIDAQEQDEQETNPEIKAAIILDRMVDCVTPLVTPLTYEGLLDDLINIDAGIIKIETDILSPPEEASEPSGAVNSSSSAEDVERPKYMHLPLNDLDKLYVEVRDQHVEKFGSFLQQQALALKASHTNFSDKNKDLSEIHQFVKQIPIFTKNLKSLTNHINLAELVKRNSEQTEFRQRWETERSMIESETCYDTIEDLIASQYPPFRLLRLLCLQSLTNGGIKTSRYDLLKREVVQTYGYEYLFLLQNLEKMGMLKKRESFFDTTSSFATIRKQLALIQADVDPSNPDDISYVSSGYAPISVRIVQTAVKGWSGKEEVLRELPGRGVDIIQRSPPEDFLTAVRQKSGSTLDAWATQSVEKEITRIEDKPVLLVYYVGGVSYAEIASFRFLSRRMNFPYQVVICTTKIINGSSFIRSLK